MNLKVHGDEKYVNSSRVASSDALGWSDLRAETWIHNPGRLKPLRPAVTEIAIQLNGTSRVKRRGDGLVQDTCSSPGTIWLCPAGIYERSVRIYAQIANCLHIYIPHRLITRGALEEFGIDPDKAELRYEGGFQDPFVEQIAISIRDEMEDPSNLSPLLVETMRVALGAHLLKNYSNLAPARTQEPNFQGGIDARRMYRLVEFIEENMHRAITLAELAAEACYSPHHFARLFKETTGESPARFIKLRRIESAKQLLRDGTVSLTDIASRTGFSSQSHFNRAFMAEVGLSPGAYRNTQ